MRQGKLVCSFRDMKFLPLHITSQTNGRRWRGFTSLAVLAALLLAGSLSSRAQDGEPFAVSNPKNLKWPAEEASRIYYSACYLAARTVRPEKPPQLRP